MPETRTLCAVFSIAALVVGSAAFECTIAQAQMQHDKMNMPMQMQDKSAPAKDKDRGAVRTFKAGAIVIEGPWMRATPRGAQVAGGYLKVTNTGREPDRLVGGSIERAGRFEVHEMTMANNVMRMRPLAKGLEIKPGQSIELKPGGYHIMGLELQGGFSQGQTVKGTLTFEKAGTVDIEYAVVPVGGGGPGEHRH